MTIVEYYRSVLSDTVHEDDFLLHLYRDNLFIGQDSDNVLCVVIKSSSKSTSIIRQKTKMLSVECNTRIRYSLNGTSETAIVHIIRCFASTEKEKELFLELVDAMIVGLSTDEQIMEVFRTLIKFFADKMEPSDAELMGLFAEVDAIIHFSPDINLANYWQSKDRLKFDFSFTDSLKLEVKATSKSFRTHHFRHEQLMADTYSIYILSYMLRYDDEGITLLDHLYAVKPLLKDNPQKLLRINKVLKNVSEERLQALRFSPEYTDEKRHLYRAENIPKFPQYTPEGVANAEYDCSLDNVQYENESDFLQMVTEELSKEINDGANE